MDINAHFVRKITAEAKHSPEGDTHWIVFTVLERSPYAGKETVSEIHLFTEGDNARELADQYAAAIDSVNVTFEIAQSEQLVSEPEAA